MDLMKPEAPQEFHMLLIYLMSSPFNPEVVEVVCSQTL